MSDFCNVVLTGRLTKEPELKQFNNNTVCKINIACKTGFKGDALTMFYSADIWGKQGEFVSNNFKKGGPILVNGTLDIREYNGKNYFEIKNASASFFGGGSNSKKDLGDYSSSSDSCKTVDISSIDEISDDEIPF